MAISFPIPSAHSKSVITIDNFLGADFTNSPANVDDNKSPNLKNLIRDVPGKVRKCMGYETVKTFDAESLSGYFDLSKGYDGDFTFSIVHETAGVQFLRFVEYIHTVAPRHRAWFINTEFTTLMQNFLPYTDYFDIPQDRIIYDTDQDLLKKAYDDYYDETEGVAIFNNFSLNGMEVSPYVREISGIYYIGFKITITECVNGQVGSADACLTMSPYTTTDYKINGFHRLRKDEGGLYHVGNLMIHYDISDENSWNVLYTDAADARSKSWEFDEHIYIIDGKKLLRYGQDSPESDTKFKTDKQVNEVVVNEEVTLVIKRFATSQNILNINQFSTSSPNGVFKVSDDKRVITYTDKLTEVGQSVSYRLEYTYRKGKTGSSTTVNVPFHNLIGVSDEKEYNVISVESEAYTPLVTISKDPEGGGEPYEDINLLNPAFKEQFLGKPGVTEYNLSFTELDEVEPIVEVLNADGEWEELQYGTDYTCDYEQGIITFVAAPGESPVTGEDNIRVTAYRTVDDYTDRINKCTIGALFGVSGAMDRLFLSGNPDYPNYDWYSAQYDPTYFADTSYSVLGSSGSAIIGYSIVSNYLAAHKDKYERDQNIILREGDLVESEPSFRIINTLQGAGAVAPFSFAYLATEPLFLTNQGVYAVTAQDVTGEKYAQNRSYFLDGKLLEEENLADAYGFVFNDMYWLCLNDVAYILDGLQPIQTDKSKPYATRQYVGFYRTNLPAYTMWENDGRLFFGTDDGKICRFFKDKYALESYNDDGEPIECIWETPDIIGKLFFKNKTLSHVAIKLDSAIAASVSIYVMNRGIWEFVRTDHWRARIFQFSKEVFSKHTFSCDKTQKVLPKKLRVKKVDKFRLRLTNNELNESFALYDIGFEYTETSNYMR